MVRKNLQAELDRLCESYVWDEKAALAAGDLVHLHSVIVRAELASEWLEPLGMKVAENVGIVHIGHVSLKIDLKMAPDLGFFSKPWQIRIENVDNMLS